MGSLAPDNLEIELALTTLKRPDDNEKIDQLQSTLRQLNESNVALFEKVFSHVTLGMATALLNETMEIERSGGERIANGGRRRKAGGVFLGLLKKRVTPETIKLIWKEQNVNARATKKRMAARTPLEIEIEREVRSARQKRPRSDISSPPADWNPERDLKRSKGDPAQRRQKAKRSGNKLTYVDRDGARPENTGIPSIPLCNYSDLL
eukprot:Selendium_serpulae@DN3230_c0_g1_i1.p1